MRTLCVLLEAASLKARTLKCSLLYSGKRMRHRLYRSIEKHFRRHFLFFNFHATSMHPSREYLSGTWRVRDCHVHAGSSRAIMRQLHREELREAEEWNQARLVPFVVSSASENVMKFYSR